MLQLYLLVRDNPPAKIEKTCNRTVRDTTRTYMQNIMYTLPPYDHSNLMAPFGGRGKACVPLGTCFRVHADNYGTPPAALNNANGQPPLLDTRTFPCSRTPHTFATHTWDDIRLFYYQKRAEQHSGGAPSVFFLSSVRVVGGGKEPWNGDVFGAGGAYIRHVRTLCAAARA